MAKTHTERCKNSLEREIVCSEHFRKDLEHILFDLGLLELLLGHRGGMRKGESVQGFLGNKTIKCFPELNIHLRYGEGYNAFES